MKRNRKTVRCALLLTAALLAGGCGQTEEAPEPAAESAVAVKAASARVGTLSISNEFVGTVAPQQQVTVMPMVSGVVDEIYAQVGDEVQAGQVLFHIEDDAAKLQEESAELSKQSAEAAAKAQLGSAQVLNNLSMESNIRSIQYQIDMAKEQYNAAVDGVVDAQDAKEDMQEAIDSIESSVNGMQSSYGQMQKAVAQAKQYVRQDENGIWHFIQSWPWGLDEETIGAYYAAVGAAGVLPASEPSVGMPKTVSPETGPAETLESEESESLPDAGPDMTNTVPDVPETQGSVPEMTDEENTVSEQSETGGESAPSESTSEPGTEETSASEGTEESVQGEGVFFSQEGQIKDFYGKSDYGSPETEYPNQTDGDAAMQTQGTSSAMEAAMSKMGYSAADIGEGRADSALSQYASQIASMQSQAATLKSNQASLDSSIAQAESSRDTTQKTIDFYEDNLKDAQVTYGISNGQAYQDTASSLATQIAAADVGVRSAQLQLEYYSPTSPISGTVVSRSVERYGLAQPGYAAYVISNQDAMNITFSVSGQVKDSLYIGMPVKIEKDGAEYEATVIEIGEAVESQTGGLFTVKAITDVGGDKLSSGSAVKLTVDTFRTENALLIPYDAVHFESEQAYVFVIEDGKAVRTPVTVGLINDDTVEITEGLREGAQLVATWSSQLEDGARVRIIGQSAETEGTSPEETVQEDGE